MDDFNILGGDAFVASRMISSYEKIQIQLRHTPKTWLVTGVAGFIGSNLLETLLKLDQRVVGMDNFATGHQRNLDEVRSLVAHEQWANFSFIEGDIRKLADCQAAMFWSPPAGATHRSRLPVDYVLHQAALGSVPRSLANPIATNETNISGFLNMLVAARDAQVQSFTYAASSSTYGDHPALPKLEENIGNPLSPYAVTKYVNEVYAKVFARSYGFETIGLRYFNVFGKRQDPNGAYAAVIPRWFKGLINDEDIYINGDGETSRDFCYVSNAVQMNLLAALSDKEGSKNQIYNVAIGDRTSLNQLYDMIRVRLLARLDGLRVKAPKYRDFRPGDVRHSQADITKAKNILGYAPTHKVEMGLDELVGWYLR